MPSSSGGYDVAIGFAPASRATVAAVPARPPRRSTLDAADAAQDGEDLSAHPWRTIATHGRDVAGEVRRIGEALELPSELIELVALAGQWHDLGKAHPAFQGSIGAAGGARPPRQDLAKAPREAWAPVRQLYTLAEQGERRAGFRHELASALALFAVLARCNPDHPALLGPWTALLRSMGHTAPEARPSVEITPAERRVLALGAEQFDLLAYLVMSHHGKVRASLHAAPQDQDYAARDSRGMPIRGVREGDRLPSVRIVPDAPPLPELELSLEPASIGVSPRTGMSWSERVGGLLRRHGPAMITFCEAWLRAADISASRHPLAADELLAEVEP